MNPQVRTGLLHAGSAFAGGIAMLAFMSSHSVDVYAIWDQLNVVVAQIAKLIALITPVATGAVAVYKSSPMNKLLDFLRNPKAVQIATQMPVTAQTEAVADALKKG